MTTTLYVCHPDGSTCLKTVAPDAALLDTALGKIRADTLQGGGKASVTLPGADADGDVLYTARHGGTQGNDIMVAHQTGPTGAGNENLPLRTSLVGRQLTILFATDGAGASITPTATQVETMVNADPDGSSQVVAAAQGTGASLVTTASLTPLTGGADTGHFIKFNTKPPSVARVNTVEIA